jgi:DNA-binding XRE family transcriptional regulator
MAENDSLVQFSLAIEKVLEHTEEAEQVSSNEFLTVNRNLLTDLRLEAQKLKDYRNMNKINQDRLTKLLMLLEQSIREVMNEDGTLNLPLTEVLT